MKRILLLITLIAVISIITTGCKVDSELPNQLSQDEKLADFEYMCNILKENYPFFEVNKRNNSVDWLAKKDTYVSMVKSTKNDQEFFDTMSKILNELHNGHTHMFSEKDYSYWKNLVLNWESGSNEPWLKELNNDKVLLRYNQKESKQSVSNSSDIFQRNNVASGKFDILSFLPHTNTNTKIIKKGEVAYLAVSGFDYYNIEKDRRIIKPFLNSIKDYSKLIIDIRGNGGGNDRYWIENIVQPLISKPLSNKIYWVFRGATFEEPFISHMIGNGYDRLDLVREINREGLTNTPPELKKNFKYYKKVVNTIYPVNSINFKGKIYLLVDKYVFSSAEAFAIFSKNTGFATIVGEKTGGDGIVGSPLICALPNSGYVFSLSITMGLTDNGTCNEEFKTNPDVEITQKWYNNLFQDKSINYILAGDIKYFWISDIGKLILIIALFIGIICFKIWFRKKSPHFI
ncbi:S41 family peptidase [Clostridium sp. BNL1100]|uniref:S41 family peptidase n=1 Tax=Clostridium sp. BNL1100 TaxID=755731 RepID=UPI00024A7835|nr:S41 family peptidase [Clostridium sp. BNL1100]AEY66543.1 periplasmic protease [Clostridium sp. BNL1100]